MLTTHWFDQDYVIKQLVFSDLDEKISSLLDRLCASKCGISLLRYLDTHDNSLHTMDDIAYALCENYSDVQCALNTLLDLGLANKVQVAGIAFFGATTDQAFRARMRELCAWQDRWHARIKRIEQLVDGKGELVA